LALNISFFDVNAYQRNESMNFEKVCSYIENELQPQPLIIEKRALFAMYANDESRSFIVTIFWDNASGLMMRVFRSKIVREPYSVLVKLQNHNRSECVQQICREFGEFFVPKPSVFWHSPVLGPTSAMMSTWDVVLPGYAAMQGLYVQRTSANNSS